MPNPCGFDVERITDVLGESDVVYGATVDLDGSGSIILILHGPDKEELGSIVIENYKGNLDFHYWNKRDHDYAGDPTTSFTMWTPTPGTEPTYLEDN
jgi:hypothetical protein